MARQKLTEEEILNLLDESDLEEDNVCEVSEHDTNTSQSEDQIDFLSSNNINPLETYE